MTFSSLSNVRRHKREKNCFNCKVAHDHAYLLERFATMEECEKWLQDKELDCSFVKRNSRKDYFAWKCIESVTRGDLGHRKEHTARKRTTKKTEGGLYGKIHYREGGFLCVH